MPCEELVRSAARRTGALVTRVPLVVTSASPISAGGPPAASVRLGVVNPSAESGEIGAIHLGVGFVKRLAKLMVVGDQGIVLFQKLGDLDLGRLYEMINGPAVIPLTRQGKAAGI